MDNRTIDEIRNNETKLIEEIKRLEDKISKAIEELDDPFENEDGDASWYEIAETYKEQIKLALEILDKANIKEGE